VRLILVTGGGGAGVTTFAAATAVCAADRGARTRLTAVNPAQMAAILNPSGAWPPLLTFAPTTTADVRNDAAAVLRWLRRALLRLDLNEWMAEDLPTIPVVRGAVALLAAVEGDPDLAVVDVGPSDEALALLQILCLDPAPGRRAGVGSTAGQIAGSLVAQAIALPRPDALVQGAGRRFAERIAALSSSIRNSAVSSLRVVVPADGRSAGLVTDVRTFAGLWGVTLDSLAIRAVPSQTETLDHDPLTIPLCDGPPQGVGPLRALGEAIYGARSPDTRIADSHGPYIEMHDTGADLVLPLPEQPASAFHVSCQGTELQITAGRWRRVFPLPSLLQPMHARRAWHDGDAFRVRFEV
jgi:arsenite-transporting ATPase